MSKIKELKQALLDAIFTLKEKQAEMAEEAPANKIYSEAELKVSAMEVGGKVELIDQDGQLQPAPDGSYEMESGDKFEVKDGQIVELNGEKAEDKPEEVATEEPVEAAEEVPTDEPAVEEPKEEKPNEEVEALKAEIEALKAQIEEIKAAIVGTASKEDVNQFASQVTELNNNIKKLATIPAEFSKTTTSNVIKDSTEEKLMELARIHAGFKR